MRDETRQAIEISNFEKIEKKYNYQKEDKQIVGL